MDNIKDFELFYYQNQNEIDLLRSKEIKNILIQKLGVQSSLVKRILDRKELKDMLYNILHERIQERSYQVYINNIYKTILLGAIIIIIYLCKDILKICYYHINLFLQESNYILMRKFKLISYNIKKKQYYSALLLFLSCIFEIIIYYIQFGIFLSWILPRDSYFRAFLFPMLSLPVNANTIMSTINNNKQSQHHHPIHKTSTSSSNSKLQPTTYNFLSSISNYSLDLGPMITISIFRWLVG